MTNDDDDAILRRRNTSPLFLFVFFLLLPSSFLHLPSPPLLSANPTAARSSERNRTSQQHLLMFISISNKTMKTTTKIKTKNRPKNQNKKNQRQLVRLGLNGRVRPVVRDRVFFSAVLVALGHAGIIMSRDSSMGAGT